LACKQQGLKRLGVLPDIRRSRIGAKWRQLRQRQVKRRSWSGLVSGQDGKRAAYKLFGISAERRSNAQHELTDAA